MKLPWLMSTKMAKDATNVVHLTTKETNARTDRKVGAMEIMVAGTRTTEGTGNPKEKEKKIGASAIIAARAVKKKRTAGRSTQN